MDVFENRWDHCHGCQLIVDNHAHLYIDSTKESIECYIGFVNWDTRKFYSNCNKCNKRGTCGKDIFIFENGDYCKFCLDLFGVNMTKICIETAQEDDIRNYCVECLRRAKLLKTELEIEPTKCRKCNLDILFYNWQVYIHNQGEYFCKKCVPEDSIPLDIYLCEEHLEYLKLE